MDSQDDAADMQTLEKPGQLRIGSMSEGHGLTPRIQKATSERNLNNKYQKIKVPNPALSEVEDNVLVRNTEMNEINGKRVANGGSVLEV